MTDFRTKPPVHMDMAEGYKEDKEGEKLPYLPIYFLGVWTGLMGALLGFYFFS